MLKFSNFTKPSTPPNSWIDSNASPKVKTMEGQRVKAHSLAYNTSEVKGCAGLRRWGLGRMTSKSIFTWTCTNQITSWLVCN